MWRTARGAWPDVHVGAERFLRGVARRLGSGGVASGLASTLRGLRAPELLLVTGCAVGDQAALAAFEDRLMPALDAPLRRAGATDDEVDEVKQTLRQRLLLPRDDGSTRIDDYGGRGRLEAWLKVAATRTFQNLRRGIRPSVDDDGLLGRIVAEDDPELAQLKTTYRREFRAAFAEAVGSLEPRQRTLLPTALGRRVGQRGARQALPSAPRDRVALGGQGPRGVGRRHARHVGRTVGTRRRRRAQRHAVDRESATGQRLSASRAARSRRLIFILRSCAARPVDVSWGRTSGD